MNIFLDDCVKTILYTATLLNKKKRKSTQIPVQDVTLIQTKYNIHYKLTQNHWFRSL